MFAEVNPSVDNLYSLARENVVREERRTTRKEDDKILREQATILEVDDIVDYDSEDDTSKLPNQDLATRGSNVYHAATSSSPTSTVKGPTNSMEREIIVIDD
jgi:hypothetical protein